MALGLHELELHDVKGVFFRQVELTKNFQQYVECFDPVESTFMTLTFTTLLHDLSCRSIMFKIIFSFILYTATVQQPTLLNILRVEQYNIFVLLLFLYRGEHFVRFVQNGLKDPRFVKFIPFLMPHFVDSYVCQLFIHGGESSTDFLYSSSATSFSYRLKRSINSNVGVSVFGRALPSVLWYP